VQRLKLDTEAAMLELDQILRANELSISLVAAVPGLLLSWGLVRGVWLLLLAPRPPNPRREALPCR
jgi:nuclear-control-of-ATPase protein 2